MKLGVFTVLFAQQPFEKALDYIQKSGLEAVEIGAGNYPGTAHCPVDDLLASKDKAAEWKKKITGRGLEISALSCHGNPLHPDEAFARKDIENMHKAFRLAEILGVKTVIGFSGCPGGGPKDKTPNWVTCAWPPDYPQILKWQWEQKLIPYWTKEVAFAAKHGVKMICLEMHPGFCVYNPETLLKLRAACGEAIGANFDPSHLMWQGINPTVAIRHLGSAIYHVHAKDVKVDHANAETNGVLDHKPYTDEAHRSWIFRTVGWGHDAVVWKEMITELRLIGYDYVLSIEHEDSLMSMEEGFRRAVAFMKEVTIAEPRPRVHWA